MKHKNNLTEKEIDELVVAQAEKENAWDEPVAVERDSSANLFLSPDLASRAAFFARLHNMSVDAWLKRVIQERLAFEESAFAGLKQVMEEKATYNTS